MDGESGCGILICIFIACFLLFLLGFRMGENHGREQQERKTRQEAVDLGLANYEATSEGGVLFMWGAPAEGTRELTAKVDEVDGVRAGELRRIKDTPELATRKMAGLVVEVEHLDSDGTAWVRLEKTEVRFPVKTKDLEP